MKKSELYLHIFVSYKPGSIKTQHLHAITAYLRKAYRSSVIVPDNQLQESNVLLYEQNNIAAFKRIFIEQFEFAVETYF